MAKKTGKKTSKKSKQPKASRRTLHPKGRRFRSQFWFDNPNNPGMTALYFERYLNYGLTRKEISRAPDHRHRADRLRPLALQPPPP